MNFGSTPIAAVSATIEVSQAAWRDELVDAPPVVENGEFVLPTRPGWGVEVNEAAVRARPPKS